MDVREKLVEILKQAPFDGKVLDEWWWEEKIKRIADHLISSGVTVQELYGCEYCSEDSDGYRKMIGAFSITNPFHGNVWNIETRHCKPRQIYFCPMCGRRLTKPPKGE